MKKKPQSTTKILLATYNSRTLSKDVHLLEFENLTKNFNYDIIGLSEVKRTGTNILEQNGYILSWFGVTKKRGSVGFFFKSKWKNNVEISYLSDRVGVLKQKSRTMNMFL